MFSISSYIPDFLYQFFGAKQILSQEVSPQQEGDFINKITFQTYASLDNCNKIADAAIAKITTAAKNSFNQNRKIELTTLLEKTRRFLSLVPGTKEHEQELARLYSTISTSRIRRTPEEQIAVKEFFDASKKIVSQLETQEKERLSLKTEVPQGFGQKIWQYLLEISKIILKFGRDSTNAQSNRPIEEATEFADTLSTQINALDTEHLKTIEPDILAAQKTTLKALGEVEFTPPSSKEVEAFAKDYPFYNHFRCIHRGGNLLKGEGEFVIVESLEPISPDVETSLIDFDKHLPNDPIEVVRETQTYQDVRHTSNVLRAVRYKNPIQKASLVNGQLVFNNQGTFKLYRIPVKECAGAIMDDISIGTRQRYEIVKNNLIFRNKPHKDQEEHWNNESRKRTAALERLQSVLIMQEFIKVILSGKLDTLEFRDYNNAMAFLNSVESNDLARQEMGGYWKEPVYRNTLTLFHRLKDQLKEYMIQRHVHKNTQEELLTKKSYSWELDKKRFTILRGMREGIDKIKPSIVKLKELLDADQNDKKDTRWQWMIGKLEIMAANAQEILNDFKLPEQDNASSFFQRPNANREMCDLMQKLVNRIGPFYKSTSEFFLFARGSIFHDIFKIYEKSIGSRYNPFNTAAFAKMDKVKQEIFTFIQTLQSGMPKIEGESRTLFMGTPFEKNALTILDHHKAFVKAFDDKEVSRLDFLRTWLTRPHDDAMNEIFPLGVQKIRN